MNTVTAEFDSPLGGYFLKAIYKNLVHITRKGSASGESCGTGTIIGWRQWNDRLFPVILTARHVVEYKTQEKVEYELATYEIADDGKVVPFRTASFEQKLGDAPPLCVSSSNLDIGIIFGPATCDDGTPFNKREIPYPQVETGGAFQTGGTPAAWAGFPGIVAGIAGKNIPCYFTGAISAIVLEESFQGYLIDGHNTFGVSGGPLWIISDDGNPKIYAVIWGYESEGRLPGFVHATPIQPAIEFLRANFRFHA